MVFQTKKWIIKNFLKKIYYKFSFAHCCLGKNVSFRDGFRVVMSKSAKLVVGEDTFFNNFCSINCLQEIAIGRNCLFGEGVKLYDHNHRFGRFDIPIRNQGFSIRPIHIGDNVWVGSNVLILAGANIGNHCVIAGGVVVDYTVPDHSLVKRNGQIVSIIEK